MQNLHVVCGRERPSLCADKPPQLLAIVEQITSGFDQLLSLTVGPDRAADAAADAAVEFDELRAAFEKLEATVAKKHCWMRILRRRLRRLMPGELLDHPKPFSTSCRCLVFHVQWRRGG